jgi:hypothetical protein
MTEELTVVENENQEEHVDFSFQEMCDDCEAYVARAERVLRTIVIDLRAHPSYSSVHELLEFEPGLKWLISFASGGEFLVHDESIKIRLSQFVSTVNTVSSAFADYLESKDYVALADVLEYELIPAMQDLSNTVHDMRAH